MKRAKENAFRFVMRFCGLRKVGSSDSYDKDNDNDNDSASDN